MVESVVSDIFRFFDGVVKPEGKRGKLDVSRGGGGICVLSGWLTSEGTPSEVTTLSTGRGGSLILIGFIRNSDILSMDS